MITITRINFLLLFLSHAIATPRFNLSHFIFPTISDEFRPQPSIFLTWNTSHAGLKRILVGENITVEVKNAQNVSVLQPLDLGNQTERKLVTHWEQCNQWFFPCLICMSVLPVRIFGSASVVAFGTQNPKSDIISNLLSENVIELLPDICYAKHTHNKQQFPIASLRPKIKQLEKVLKSFLGDIINRNAGSAKLKAKIEASTAFHFQLEIERNIKINDTRWTSMAEWRTRPTIECVWFEVLARIERKRLKPLSVKKIKPFVGVDSSAWSNLMANMSSTKLSSVLVAPEALTM